MKIYKLSCVNKEKDHFINFLVNFVEKSKYKYKIIYKNKIIPLKGILKIVENNIETSKFKLISYEHSSDIYKILDSFYILSFDFPEYFEFEKIIKRIKKI